MAKLRLTQASRKALAKSGVALPNGKFPIPDKAHLRAAIAYRHSSSTPVATVNAHIRKRAKALGAKVPAELESDGVIVLSWDPEALVAAGPPKGKYGRSTSLKWPHLYDILKSKGYSSSKAAAISNSRLKFRKKGRLNVLTAQQAHNPAVLKRLAKADRQGKHLTGKQLTKGL